MPIYKDTAYLLNHSKQKIETWQCFGISNHVQKQQVKNLAQERGEAPDAIGTGRRNVHLLAIAPNASSSIICGNTSPSIEPYRANAYTQKTKSGSSLQKNEYLQAVLQDIEMDTEEVWKDIVTNGGSVQHLEFLDEWTKYVFKTAVEIDQRWIIDMAADDKNKFVKVNR